VDDYATVSVAGRLDFDEDDVITGARVVLGAVGPVPIRATAVETMLAGANAAEIDVDAVAAEAAHAADPVDDARGSADYKREMTRVITARTLRRLLGTEVPN
jgi:CO/xanthine dehydrogenase FAD-binding subunit